MMQGMLSDWSEHSATFTHEERTKKTQLPASFGQVVMDFLHQCMHAEGLDMMMGLMEHQKEVQECSLRNTSMWMRTIALKGSTWVHNVSLLMVIMKFCNSRIFSIVYGVCQLKSTIQITLKQKQTNNNNVLWWLHNETPCYRQPPHRHN